MSEAAFGLELQEAREFIESSLEAMVWTAEPERVLSNEQWAEHRGTWGSMADDDKWTPVADAFMAVANVRRKNFGANAGTTLHPGDESSEDAEGALTTVREGLAFLDESDRQTRR